MAVDWGDTPGSTLPSRSEEINFSTDRDVKSVRVVYDEEQAFDGSTFPSPYASSSKVGNVFALRRTGGWQKPFYVYVDEEASPAEFGVGDLQPTLYSPVAQWALRGAPVTATTYADRSGNGRNLTAGTPVPCPDAIPGQKAVTRCRLTRGVDAALSILGAITVTARVWLSTSAGTQVVAAVGNAGGLEAQNTAWLLGTLSSGNVYTYTEHGAAVGSVLDSGLALTPGQWSFVSLRRASDGTSITFDVDGATSSGSVVAATGASSSSLVIGEDPVSGTLQWLGGIADVSVWSARLSDEELLGQRKVMMGIP